MASSLHAESRRLYSWWWDSHISPKNSKWLQDNLTDMDSKVKAMIKLIEEDADSFARRAEMYYKKRPELMKMVEEFYRAYRALAERYDHATGALRQAHKTMAEAFPNQIPFVLTDESPSSSSGTEMEPHTPEMPAPVRAFFDSDDIQKDPLVISSHFHVIKRKGAYCEENDALTSRKGLKQLNEMIAAREGDAFSYLTEGRAKKVLNFQEEEGKNSENKTHYWARNLQNQESSEEEEYSQELSKLSKENQNLKSQIASESERADKAESEVQSLQDRLSRLNFEMEASIRKYQQSLERISDLETQISHTQDEFKKLNDEIVNGSMKLSSTEERGLLLEKRNQSLQSELDTIEQKTKTQQEELSKSLEESEKLSITIQDEHQQRMEAEMALLSMEKLYSQSQEELKTLALEVQRGIDKLKEMELTNLGLEEEICQLKEENASLNEQNLSSDLKIKDLRDEINILKETIGKVESDVGLHLEEKKVLQREFDCVKEDKHDLEQRHRGLTEEMEAVILNTESLQASIKELQDGTVELKEICKKHEDENLVLLENLKNMEKTSEKNVALELSLSDANVELEGLRGKIKTLEGSCESLHGQIITHISEKAVLVSQVETTAQNVEKLTEKNAFLENSLSDMNAELEGLRGKLKNLEESYQSLYDQKTNLLAEKNTLVSQVESISQSLNNLESKHAELEDKHLHFEREKDLTLHQVMELECFLKLQKQEHETLARSNKIQLATLGNQIRLLREERRVREEEFEVEQQKVMSALFEIFILQRCLNDMKAKNLVLSKGCQKHLQASRCAEELVSQLEQNDLFQKEKITSLSEHNEKLREGILLLLRALNINKSFESTDGVKDEVLLQIILAEIKKLLNSISDSQDEIQHLQLEILFTVTTLKQIGLDVKDLRIENDLLKQELEIRKEELFVTQSKNQELLELNEHMRQEVQVRGESEEELKAQMETLIWQLSDSQEAQRTFKTEIQKLLEENHCVSAKLHNLREEKDALEEENCVLVTEATTLEHLYLLFRSANAERALELKLCSDDMDCLCAVKSNLDQEITELNEKMSVLQVEKNMHLKESAAYLEEYRNHLIISEFDLNTARYICEELNHQIETGKNLLIQKEMELYEANQKVQSMHDINTELNRNLEGLNQDIDGAKMVREELENKVFSLSESIASRDHEIAHTTEANKMLYIKLENLNSKVEELQSREEHLTSNLQKGIVEIDQCGKDITTLLDDNQISTVSAAIFEEKVFELILGCESLEIIAMLQREMLNEEITSRNIFINELTKKHDEMEGENRGLKANLDAYLPLIMSLRDSIASVEERTLSLAGTHASNCQEKQDDSLVSHQHDKSTPLSEDHSTVVPVGLLELHKLIAKVEALQKMLTDAGSFLQQEIFDATANLEAARTELEALKVKGSSVQEEEHVSKDIIMELIKKDEEPGTDHNRQKDDTEISKMKCEHKMKDIQLDEVLSSPPYVNGVGPYGLTRIENSGTDDQMLELWEAAERDCNTQMQQAPVIALEHDIEAIEEEKSEHPSSELVAEKELSIDSVEVPTEFEESRQEWNRNVIKRLASDAERVSILRTSVEELKRKMEDSEKSKRSKSLEYDTVRMKLKEAEGGILELIDTNTELTKKAEEIGSTGRKQISERAQSGSEKIGSLELELQKIQYILLKLNEEHENNRTKSADRGPKIILREYIYGKREKLRKKKSSFCRCMRPKTKGD